MDCSAQYDLYEPFLIWLELLFSSLADTMVCTGCCSSLDHIVTYLFKQLSRSTKKRAAPMAQESDRFFHIMQQHPEMIQQVSALPFILFINIGCFVYYLLIQNNLTYCLVLDMCQLSVMQHSAMFSTHKNTSK